LLLQNLPASASLVGQPQQQQGNCVSQLVQGKLRKGVVLFFWPGLQTHRQEPFAFHQRIAKPCKLAACNLPVAKPAMQGPAVYQLAVGLQVVAMRAM
jgi:hypothetical protein